MVTQSEHAPTFDESDSVGSTETTVRQPTSVAAARFRIPPDVIVQAIKELPEEQRNTISWFAGYMRSKNVGTEDAEQLLKKESGEYYSWDSIYQVLTGRRMKYGNNIEPILAAMRRFRTQIEGSARSQVTDYVHTRLSAAIWRRCDKARETKRIGMIFGDSQIGKTVSLRRYQSEHNHGATLYVEMPAGGYVSDFRCVLANAIGLPVRLNGVDMQRRILASLCEGMLLIIDEVHRCFAGNGATGLKTLDLIRQIYNHTGCGMMLSMTHEGRAHLINGRNAKALQQIWRRRTQPLSLPATVPKDDLALFAAKHGLPPAPDDQVKIRVPFIDSEGNTSSKEYSDNPMRLQTDVVAREGLGIWLEILRDAAGLAKDAKKPITWGAVLKAHCMAMADEEVFS